MKYLKNRIIEDDTVYFTNKGEDIISYRLIRRIKQKEFAEILGIPQRKLSLYESNSIAVPLVIMKALKYYRNYERFKEKYTTIRRLIKLEVRPKMLELQLRLKEEIELFIEEF